MLVYWKVSLSLFSDHRMFFIFARQFHRWAATCHGGSGWHAQPYSLCSLLAGWVAGIRPPKKQKSGMLGGFTIIITTIIIGYIVIVVYQQWVLIESYYYNILQLLNKNGHWIWFWIPDKQLKMKLVYIACGNLVMPGIVGLFGRLIYLSGDFSFRVLCWSM
jgi:hypothetical protein